MPSAHLCCNYHQSVPVSLTALIPAPRRCSLPPGGAFQTRLHRFSSSLENTGVRRAGGCSGGSSAECPGSHPQGFPPAPGPLPAALGALPEGSGIPGRIWGVLHLQDLPVIQRICALPACPGWVVVALLCPSPGGAAGDPQDAPRSCLVTVVTGGIQGRQSSVPAAQSCPLLPFKTRAELLSHPSRSSKRVPVLLSLQAAGGGRVDLTSH